jgi:hypothetical protein
MAQSILVFDFGTNEEAAQQAKHKVEAWTQGMRLGKKILLKFDRVESAEANGAATENLDVRDEATTKDKSPKATGGKKSKSDSGPDESVETTTPEETRIRVLVRLDFSDHEKLSSQRWLDRIPTEEPFKSAKSETIRHNSTGFAEIAERFNSLS